MEGPAEARDSDGRQRDAAARNTGRRHEQPRAHYGKLCYGAIGFGSFKLEVHQACIARLFETNDAVLDAPEIFELAQAMVLRP